MTRSLELLVLRLGARILLRELQLMETDARAAAREVSLLLEAALGLAGVLGGHRRVSRQRGIDFRRNSVNRSFAVSHFHTPSTFKISTLLPLFAQRSPIFHAYFQSRR